MARKLKTYQTSLGFFDQAIAAPSMKAALAAWALKQSFHQRAAKESRQRRDLATAKANPHQAEHAAATPRRAAHWKTLASRERRWEAEYKLDLAACAGPAK